MKNLWCLLATLGLSAHVFATSQQRQSIHEAENQELTIIEFGDFQCPYCKVAAESVQHVIVDYGDRVQIVFRNFPLDQIHPDAHSAAVAGVCASEQNGFATMYDFLYAHQKELGHDTYLEGAKTAGLDLQSFATCLDSTSANDQVDRDYADGQALHVQGTPSFFFSSKGKTVRLNGAYPYPQFKSTIEDLLKH